MSTKMGESDCCDGYGINSAIAVAWRHRPPHDPAVSGQEVVMLNRRSAISSCMALAASLSWVALCAWPNAVHAKKVFVYTGSMLVARDKPSAILDNGTVFVLSGVSNCDVWPCAERYDQVGHMFDAIYDYSTLHAYGGNIATLLKNGKVLLAGGGGTQAALFDPSASTFVDTFGKQNTIRDHPLVALASNGQVLLAGGNDTNGLSQTSAETYDPVTDGFTPTVGSLSSAVCCGTATPLLNGTILVAGGYQIAAPTYNSVPSFNSQTFDPSTGIFYSTPRSLNAPRAYATATLLPSGKVLIAGGCGYTSTPLASTEIFDPQTGYFTASTASVMTTPRCHATAVLLGDGTVLVAGGVGPSNQLLNSAEIYDPATTHFTAVASMNSARVDAAAVLLPDGTVLIAGGWNVAAGAYNPLGTAELYEDDEIFKNSFD